MVRGADGSHGGSPGEADPPEDIICVTQSRVVGWWFGGPTAALGEPQEADPPEDVICVTQSRVLS